ncbi:PPE domain-containing protein [Actinosynnema sp. CA-299493]
MTPPNSQPPSNSPSPQDTSQATQVTYAGQTDAELRAEYERASEANPGLFNNIFDYIRYKQQSAQNQANQEQQLEQVVENYRPPLSPPGSHYLGYDHKALKDMVTTNMSPSTANEQGEAWTKLGNTLAELQTNLSSATAASKGAWQGAAAESAQGYFTNVATWSGNAAQGAQLTGNKLYTQSTAAEQAKNAMPEPVEFSTADAYKMFFAEPNPFKWAATIDQIEQKFEEKQQAHERAAEVMTTMSTSFQESGSTMPAFSAPPPMEGSGGSGDPGKNGTGEINGRQTIPSGTGTGTGTGGGFGDVGVPGGGGSGSGSGSGGGGGNTNQSGWNGPGGGGNTNLPGGGGGGNTNLPGGGGGGPYPPGYFPPGGGGQNNRPTIPPGGRPGLPNGPGTRGPGGGPGGGGMGRVPGGGGAGGPGGMAAAGRGGMGGFGPGGSAGTLGDAGRSGAGGFGPGGSGGLGGAGAAGRGGPGGMGAGMGAGAGGARGQGDEDKEHKAASYLVETEDVFGDGTMVAPPVIGG